MLRALIKSSATAVIDKLPFSVLYEAFYQTGRRLGVTAYSVDGSAGLISGPLFDQSVIKPYLRLREWSPEIVGVFKEFFEGAEGGTFYDVGANIGLTTIPLASSRTDIRCVAFEPDPLNFTLLKGNVARNCDHQNVELVNAAISNSTGQLRFRKSEYNAGDHRLSDDGQFVVNAIRLDDLPVPKGRFGVKIDVQGAEPSVFAGGGATLAAADLVVCEFWPWGMRRAKMDPSVVIDFVAENFRRGEVISGGRTKGECGIDVVVSAMKTLVSQGSQEFAQADLILRR